MAAATGRTQKITCGLTNAYIRCMRNLLIVFTTSLLLAACQERSQEQTTESDPTLIAQYSISDYLMRSLGANSGYEGVSFGALDTAWQSPDMDTANYYMEMSEYYLGQAESALFSSHEKSQMYSDSSIYFSNMAVDYINNYPKIRDGWRMEHTYRSMMRDTLQVFTATFYLNDSLQVTGLIPEDLDPE